MAIAVDSDYNALSRYIIGKVDFYFDGDDAEPVTVSHSDGLIDFALLEEANADSDSLFGNVTANEVTVTIYNDGGKYSPTNESSPYYGKMRNGLKVVPSLKVADKEYMPLGIFYVNEWHATITGTTARITAADMLYTVFNKPMPALPVVKNTDTVTFATQLFDALGVVATVDSNVAAPLAMSYVDDSVQKVLTDLATGSMAVCNCGRDGAPSVKSLVAPRSLRATLTDADQLISVAAEMGLSSDYDGAGVTYYAPQESATTNVLSLKELSIPAGVTTHMPVMFTTKPVIRLTNASLASDFNVSIDRLAYDSSKVTLTTSSNLAVPVQADVEVYGTAVEAVERTIGDDESNQLHVDNIYIQSAEYANEYLEVLKAFVEAPMPILRVTIRGNPLLNVLDKITIASDKFNLLFTGLILRNELTYNGGLSSELTLLNIDVLEV